MTQWGIDALFNPAKRHMDEEKRRLQSTREEVGDSSGGKRIDFESGKVTIKRADADDEPDDTETRSDAKSGRSRKTRNHPVVAESAQKSAQKSAEPSPAAVRAAARRGRQPR